MLATHFWMQLQRLSVCLSLCLVGAFIDSVRGKFSPYWKTELLARNAMNNFHNEGLLGSRSQALIYSRTYVGTPCVLFLCKKIFDLWWYIRRWIFPLYQLISMFFFDLFSEYLSIIVTNPFRIIVLIRVVLIGCVLTSSWKEKGKEMLIIIIIIFKNQFKDWTIIIN